MVRAAPQEIIVLLLPKQSCPEYNAALGPRPVAIARDTGYIPFMGFGIGFQEMLVIGVIVLVLFGPNKLPQMARDLGRFINEARQSIDELKEELTAEDYDEEDEDYEESYYRDYEEDEDALEEDDEDYEPPVERKSRLALEDSEDHRPRSEDHRSE
jgi:Tat protein translocase TatB subunit